MCIRDRSCLTYWWNGQVFSGLGVYNFVKYSTYSYYPKEILADFQEDVVTFAKSEGLSAHANSISVRFDDEKKEK